MDALSRTLAEGLSAHLSVTRMPDSSMYALKNWSVMSTPNNTETKVSMTFHVKLLLEMKNKLIGIAVTVYTIGNITAKNSLNGAKAACKPQKSWRKRTDQLPSGAEARHGQQKARCVK
jgi:hypothetical protein